LIERIDDENKVMYVDSNLIKEVILWK
jgi:hypothetical protein